MAEGSVIAPAQPPATAAHSPVARDPLSVQGDFAHTILASTRDAASPFAGAEVLEWLQRGAAGDAELAGAAEANSDAVANIAGAPFPLPNLHLPQPLRVSGMPVPDRQLDTDGASAASKRALLVFGSDSGATARSGGVSAPTLALESLGTAPSPATSGGARAVDGFVPTDLNGAGTMSAAASGVSALAPDPASTRAAALAPVVTVPVQRPEFGVALAERVLWQVEQRVQTAQLHLNPPELGPLEVKVELSRGDAHVHFVSAHGQVRDAIENALPRLRDLLADAGLRLADASVSADSGGDGRGTFARPDPAPEHEFGAHEARDDAERALGVSAPRSGRGLIDYYV